MRVATIDSHQPWVEVRFGVRFFELAEADTVTRQRLVDEELRAASRREGSSNWFLDNGCHVAHRISAAESVLAASCVADDCIVGPLGRLASIHDMMCSTARHDPALSANWLLIGGPPRFVDECVAHILDRLR